MKKIFVFLIMLVCLLPFTIDAKACKVVSGTGKELGDEIACGDEHFYVLEYKDGKIKMITKYNLFVGNKIDRGSDYFDDESEAEKACLALLDTYDEKNVDMMAKFNPDGDPEKFFCRVFTPLEYDSVKQNELAKGLYPNGNMEVAYPIYGNIFLDAEVAPDEFDENLDLVPDKSIFKEYFDGYKETLTKLGVTVLDMGFIKRSGVQDVIDKVGTEKVIIPTTGDFFTSDDPLKLVWEEFTYWDYLLLSYKVNIKEYLPEKYSWLYGTSYWTGSATKDTYGDKDHYSDEFITTVGDYCSFERGCEITNIGLGLRPVVTISESDVGEEVPNTLDNVIPTFLVAALSLTGLLVTFTLIKKH